MPLSGRFLSFVSRPFTRNFASKAARFQLAVTAGFAVAAIGFLTIVVGDQNGFAEGFLESLFGGQSLFGQAPQYQTASRPIPAPYRHVAYKTSAHRHSDRVKAIRFASAQDGNDAEPIAVSSGTHSVCVRLCDGFTFPLGAYRGESDRASHEATCHSECPGAQTALFLLSPGSEQITDAVNARTGKPYSSLPDAFHYTTVLDEACTCHPAAGNRIKSLLHDFTLRRGDAVMTARGFRVFHGAEQYPFRRRDFVALNKSPDIRNETRATYKAIERASLQGAPTVVAQQPAPDAISKNGTKQLEHQASR